MTSNGARQLSLFFEEPAPVAAAPSKLVLPPTRRIMVPAEPPINQLQYLPINDRPKFPLPEEIDLASMPGGTLKNWQVEDLFFIEAWNGLAVIGHVRGAGKTPVGLAWAYWQPDLRPAIFIVPANVKRQWLLRTVQWMGIPAHHITVITGRKEVRPTTPIIIINWDILASHAEALQELRPKLIEYDELARGKNSDAKRTQQSTALAHFPSVVSRLGLTGTEYMNRPDEGWPQDRIINPMVFPNRMEYRHKFCNPTRKQTTAKRDAAGEVILGADGKPIWNYSWDFNGASNVDQLNEIRRHRLFVRRTKAEIRPESPDPVRETVPLNVSLKEYSEIDRRARPVLKELQQEMRRRRFSLQGLSDDEQKKLLSEHAEADSLVKLFGVAWSEMSALRKATGLAKVPGIIEWCRDFLEEEVPLLLFIHHHEVSDPIVAGLNLILQERGMRRRYPNVSLPRALDGRMSQKRRDDWADKFIAGEIPILPAGLMAMNEGYDGLQHRASNMGIGELGWNPSTHDQAEGRLDREGQINLVNCSYLIVLGTFDDDMARVNDSKGTVTSASYGEVPPPGIIESLMESYLGG